MRKVNSLAELQSIKLENLTVEAWLQFELRDGRPTVSLHNSKLWRKLTIVLQSLSLENSINCLVYTGGYIIYTLCCLTLG